MSDRRWSWPFVIGVNVLAGAAAWVAAAPAAPAVARMLGAALLVLVIPGLGWLGLARRRELDLPRLSLAVVGLSSVACVGGAALLAITVGEPSRALLLVWLGIVTNAGFAATGTPGTLDRKTPWGFLAIVGAVAFVVSSTAATRLVPPLEDHDMEVRGTAYGLVSEFNDQPIDFNQPAFWAHFLRAIAYREGMGDALAEGATSGLTGMRERAELLGGSMALETTPGGGTRLLFELPLVDRGTEP